MIPFPVIHEDRGYWANLHLQQNNQHKDAVHYSISHNPSGIFIRSGFVFANISSYDKS